MIKVEVIEKFTLKEFDKLSNIQRKGLSTKGTLYVGDTFECDEKMAKYLTGDNVLNKTVVKVIEVEPEKEEPKVVIKEVAVELPKKQKKSKKSKK